MSPTFKSPRTRLYIGQPFAAGADIPLTEQQSHYIAHVLRQQAGDTLAVFNGHDGEWLASIKLASKKSVIITLQEALRPQKTSPDLWLLAAPLKAGKTEIVVEQATELGISCFIPVYTQFTVVTRVNQERLEIIAMEAAEQSERMDIPQIGPLTHLPELLTRWDPKRTIIYGDESGASKQPGELFSLMPKGKYAVLIGPEGGFSAQELALLRETHYALGLCMGPRIMRAPTAAIAAITLVQSWFGDWHDKPAFRSAS